MVSLLALVSHQVRTEPFAPDILNYIADERGLSDWVSI
jgi:hypothetical protein